MHYLLNISEWYKTKNTMKLTHEEAKRLSILKWEAIVKNNGSSEHLPEILASLLSECGYCEKYRDKWNRNCGKCPLNLKGNLTEFSMGCLVPGHPWNIWADNKTKENAQAVLDLILKT